MTKRLVLAAILSLFAMGTLAEEPRFIKKAGEGIEKGGAAAGRGIKKGGEAAGRGIEKGVKYPVKGIKKTGDWLDRKLGKGGKKEKAGD
jgi:hypothetical protein